MKTLITACALLVAASAFAEGQVVKVINDKGSFYVKIDPKAGITEGTELKMVADDKGSKEVGSATVMEIKGSLARVSLDDDAAKASAKFALLPEKGAAAPAQAAAAPANAKPKPPQLEKPPAGTALKGHIEASPMRVSAYNESDEPWSDCELHFNDGRYYQLGNLSPHSDDGVMTIKFTSPKTPEPAYDHVVVSCDEGESKFIFANPRAPGGLKGYAEDDSGKLVLHNESDKDWSRCDITKPDGSHYLLGTLKAHDHETMRGGLFKKDKDMEKPSATMIWLACKQGVLTQPLK